MDKNDIQKLIDQTFQRQMTVPRKLKINEQYLNELIKNNTVKFEQGVSTYYGVPVEIDDTVETFKFIYK